MKTYILRAPNGDWLVLQEGAQDRLLSTHKTYDAANRAKLRLDRQAA